MKIVCSIITTDRSPRQNYLSTTLEHLIASGLPSDKRFSLEIFHSGQSEVNLDRPLIKASGAVLHIEKELHPVNQAIAAGLRNASAQAADYVILLEDDVQVAADFPSFVLSQLALLPNAPIVDFATYYVEIADAYYKGERFLEMPAQKFYGTQCLAFTTQSAISFSEYITENIDLKTGFADTWIQSWLQANSMPLDINCSVPSGAQHIGVDSNLSHTYFKAQAFKDEIEQSIPVSSRKYLGVTHQDGRFFLQKQPSGEQVELNLSAQLIYMYCDGTHTIAAIERILAQQTNTDQHEINQQIRQCIANLIGINAVIYSVDAKSLTNLHQTK